MTPPTPSSPAKREVRFSEIALAYLATGATAFGGPAVLHQLHDMAVNRGWLSEEEVNDGIALVQLYPGPLGIDFVTYVGYKLRGVRGALLAALSFLLPSFLLMLAISALYFAYGSLSVVPKLFAGLEALVVGLLLNLVLDLGGKNLRGTRHALIALGAFAALVFQVNAVLIVLGALLLGAALLSPSGEVAPKGAAAVHSGLGRWLGIAGVSAVVAVAALLCLLSGSVAGDMGLVFFKIGSVAFGNGATILPLIQADVVHIHQWLSPNEFADGIAMGQITPGPFLITAAFIGYKLAGLGGAVLATFAIFSPSIAMTMFFTEILNRFKNLAPLRGALAGVMASFVGLLSVMVMQMGQIALTGPLAYSFAAGSLVGFRYFKLNAAVVFAGGLLLWGLLTMV